MKVELICTGEELLAGQILDTNSAWFANVIKEKGLSISRHTTVGDRLDDLVEVFEERSHHADLIVVNGGLGPTEDDLSAQAASEALKEDLVLNSSWQQKLERHYASMSKVIPKSNMKQALLPKSSQMIDNPYGTACGFAFKLNRAWFFFTPGVPHEFKPMVQEQLLPFIEEKFQIEKPIAMSSFLLFGIGESALQDLLDDMNLNDSSLQFGFRASGSLIELKIYNLNMIESEFHKVETEILTKLGEHVVAKDYDSLAHFVHNTLLETDKTLAVAESCSGGLLASQLINFSGSSKYFEHSLVTYSNLSKKNVLSISEEDLKQYGAVSLEVARKMALSTRAIQNSDYGLSITGIAGPDGGSHQKPVGTVCFALVTDKETFSQKIYFKSRSRNKIRELSCVVALDMLRRHLLGKAPIVEYSLFETIQSA